VGSLEEDETAPTVEALPELVVETETQAFERQERPSGDLLLGERRLVQAGAEGQIRHLIEVDAKGNRTLLQTEVVKEAVAEITEIGTKIESSTQPLDGPKVLEVKKPSLVVEEEVLAYGHEERVNPSLPVGERRLVQVGVAGLRRNLVEINSEGHRSLKGTEVLKEAVTEIVEVGTKVVKVPDDRPVTPAPATQDIKKETTKTEPKTETSVSPVQVSQVAKQEPAKAEARAQAEKTEGKQLPNTGTEVDANLVALGLAGVLSGFGLLAQKKKED
jgi:endo-beta-N-acetylglucosaminidase D